MSGIKETIHDLFLTGLALGTGLVLAIYAAPASFWFKPIELAIPDTPIGVVPTVIFERELHMPFRGEWHVILRRVDESQYATVCTATDTQPYRPDAAIPKPTDMDWLRYAAKNGSFYEACDVEPGQYRIDITWYMIVFGVFPKRTSIVSNIFSIGEPLK